MIQTSNIQFKHFQITNNLFPLNFDELLITHLNGCDKFYLLTKKLISYIPNWKTT